MKNEKETTKFETDIRDAREIMKQLGEMSENQRQAVKFFCLGITAGKQSA